MFNQFSEQVKKSSQPVSELFAANVEALRSVSSQQTSFLSGVLDDSMKMFQAMSQHSDVKALLAAQNVYAESLRERLTITSKNTYSTINTVGQQYADTMKSSFDIANVQEAKPVQAKKPAASTKVSAVKKATSAEKAPVKATSAVTPAETAKEKTVPSKPLATKNMTTKKAAKAVPALSADKVRAKPKTSVKTNTNTASNKNASKA